MNRPRLVIVMALAAVSGSTAFADITAWFAPSAFKVMRDARPSDRSPLRWELAAARNEVEACQLVLLADEPVRGLTVTVSDLRGVKGALRPELFEVRYVPCGKEKILYPDPLPPLKGPLDLGPGRAQPVWISVKVPKDTAPGTYSGRMTARAGAWRREFPLSIKVWDFAVPDTPASRTAFGISYEMAADFERVKLDSAEGKALRRRYYEFLLDHRCSPYLLPVDLMSEEAVPYLDDPRMTSFLIPIGSRTDDDLRALIGHLKNGGWFAKSYFYEIDEPITKASFDALAAYSDRLRKIEPACRAVAPFWGNPDWDASLRTKDVLLGRINIWCPHYLYLDGFPGTREFLKSRKKAGDEYWWYICNNPRRSMNNIQIDMPAVPHRVLFWQQKREGIQGFLFWGVNYWNKQYIDDPWKNQDTLGDDLYGDGSLIYPGAEVGVDGPVGSLRLEVIRDGLEDFDYFTLADEWLGPEASAAFVNRIARSLTDFDEDPLKLEQVRRELGAALERTSRNALRESFAIQPLGDVDPHLVELARSAISEAFGLRSEVSPARPLPERAFYAPGKRYRAEKLLTFLDGLRSQGSRKVVGLTSVDISTSKGLYDDWGIFGMADLGGSSCIISTYRLGRNGASADLIATRLRKVVTHEVGHILGLPHCPTPGCIMQDAQGKIATIDRSNGALCPDCQKRLARR
jgi:predicted Zn-dependent protease